MRQYRLLSTCASALALAVLAAPLAALPLRDASAQIGIGVSITVAPPPLPIYVQPPLPAPGYLWTPGFWNYGEAGYYWVPGTWVEPPSPGLLWTPGYWGFNNGIYAFNRGYWGPHVGFYGGINYGFGYGGIGFLGGEWRGREFAYNSAVNNFGGVHVTNVYNRTVINEHVTNVSFNGPNGVNARPRPEELAYAREAHVQPTPLQQQHEQAAARNPDLRASVNHGAPAVAATARPGEFRGPGVTPARAAEAGRANEPARGPGAAAHEAGARPGEPAGARPGEAGGARPGTPAGARPGEAAGTHPGAATGTHPALRSPGATPHVTHGPTHAVSQHVPAMAPRATGMAPRPMAGPRPAMGAPHAVGGAPHAPAGGGHPGGGGGHPGPGPHRG